MRKKQNLKLSQGISDPLSEWLTPYGKINLARGHTFFYDVYHADAVKKIFTAQLQLMQYVVWGDQARAEAMLKPVEAGKMLALANKEKISALLWTKLTKKVREPSGKEVKNLTPFQAALCAGDVEMCKMFKGYFEQINGGLEEMKTQFDEIFPEGVDAHVEIQKKQVEIFEQKLKGIFTKIIDHTKSEVKTMLERKEPNSQLDQIFETFRKEVKEISYNSKERVFNPYYLLSAIKIYHDFIGNRQAQRLFCSQIIGFMQRYLSAYYLQAFLQNILKLVKGAPFVRNFEILYSLDGRDLRARRIPSFSGLGFNYCASGDSSLLSERCYVHKSIFDLFLKKNQQAIASLCNTTHVLGHVSHDLVISGNKRRRTPSCEERLSQLRKITP